MPEKTIFLAIDQGTTGTTALLFSGTGETLARQNTEFPQHFPKPGWVEHDVEEIWSSVRASVSSVLQKANISGKDLTAIGITNQRETTVLWDRKTRAPIANAIVWQCRRTADVCEQLRSAGHEELFRERTGLVLDAYFSGTKIAWLLDHVAGARGRDLQFGTVDTFLIHRLTGGKEHVTDVSNASRTLLMNLATLSWDPELAAILKVPTSVLPRIAGSAEIVGKTQGLDFLPDGIPIAGIGGDQQAALFGQACFDIGSAKCTYGTGAFVLMNIGPKPIPSKEGLLTTVAWKIGNDVAYALEGSAFVAGAVVQWLRDGLSMIRTAEEIEALAASVSSSEGVTFVPALSGLGAPYWDPHARGTIGGLTRGSTKAHIARAALEGIGLEVMDLLAAMARDAGKSTTRLKVDGGACRNNLLMQFQSDIAEVTVDRPVDVESTGRGAAMLAAVGCGALDLARARAMVAHDRTFSPSMSDDVRNKHRARWKAAIQQSRINGN